MHHNLFTSNFKCILRRIVAFVISIIAIFVFISFYNRITYTGSTAGEFYYDLPNNVVDIAAFGSSHVYRGINPILLWDEYGYRTVDFATGAQPLWAELTYLEDVLKKQSPQLVIMDLYVLGFQGEAYEADYEKQTIGSYVGFKPSVNKLIDLYNVSRMATHEPISWDHFWVFPVNHTKYNLLRIHNYERDPRYHSDSYLGYYYTDERTAVEYDVFDPRSVRELVPINSYQEKCLRDAIELCQKNGINVLLTNTYTNQISAETQKAYNYVKSIADEYGVVFVNGCEYYDEIGIDQSTDFFDDEGHLSHSGATKYTKWLADNYISKYNVSRRSCDELKSGIWVIKSNALHEHEIGNYIDSVHDNVDDLDAIVDLLNSIDGFSYILIDNREGVYTTVVVDAGNILAEYDNNTEYKMIRYYDDRNLMLKSEDDVQRIIIDKDEELTVEDGQVGLVVYSKNRARFQFVDYLEVK